LRIPAYQNSIQQNCECFCPSYSQRLWQESKELCQSISILTKVAASAQNPSSSTFRNLQDPCARYCPSPQRLWHDYLSRAHPNSLSAPEEHHVAPYSLDRWLHLPSLRATPPRQRPRSQTTVISGTIRGTVSTILNTPWMSSCASRMPQGRP